MRMCRSYNVTTYELPEEQKDSESTGQELVPVIRRAPQMPG